MELPYDSNRWFTPRYALNYLSRLFVQHGEKVIKHNSYKKVREAWILGLALLGISKQAGQLWWLQVPADDPPDMRAMTIVPDPEKNQNEMHSREVEIVMITKFTSAPIEDEILRKLKNKSYVKETCLLIYLNRNTYIEDMRKLAEKLKGKINVADVWVVGATAPDSPKHILFSLYPDVQVVEFDIFEEMAKIPKGDTIDMEFAKGTKMTLIEKVRPTKFIP